MKVVEFKLITNFKVLKELFEDTQHEKWHFELCLDDKEYQGYYEDGEVNWFQMQPNPDDHEISLEMLDVEVKKRMSEWLDSQ